jgi:hypothetical protein
MRKQSRRLWLGDWQRGVDSDDADRVTIITEDDESSDRSAPQSDKRKRVVAGVAAVAALVALGFGLAAGGHDEDESVSERPQAPPAQIPQTQPQVPPGQGGQGFGGPDLTGAEATKAAKAALGQYPGDLERVTRGPGGGGYVVHVIQPDGNEVHVLVDDEFEVQGSDANSGPRNFGGGGTSQ